MADWLELDEAVRRCWEAYHCGGGGGAGRRCRGWRSYMMARRCYMEAQQRRQRMTGNSRSPPIQLRGRTAQLK